MAFIPAGDTEKSFLALVIITSFLYWRNGESVSKIDAIRKKQEPFFFREKRGIKETKISGFLALSIVSFINSIKCSLFSLMSMKYISLFRNSYLAPD